MWIVLFDFKSDLLLILWLHFHHHKKLNLKNHFMLLLCCLFYRQNHWSYMRIGSIVARICGTYNKLSLAMTRLSFHGLILSLLANPEFCNHYLYSKNPSGNKVISFKTSTDLISRFLLFDKPFSPWPSQQLPSSSLLTIMIPLN